ncbi:MAG: hypothetical protein CUN52_11025, partial [Phototrophicales bacterium]
NQLKANLSDSFRVTGLIGEFHQNLSQYCENKNDIAPKLQQYAKNALKLHLDIIILVENLQHETFELVIIEAKKVKNLSLTNLSQLIGYCIVANVNYGILINVDQRVSNELALILTKMPTLTHINRIYNQQQRTLGLGVMTYNHQTRQIEPSDYGHFKTISQLAKQIERHLTTIQSDHL